MKFLLTLAIVSLGGCGAIDQARVDRQVALELEARDSALCAALQDPTDEFADALLRLQKETPDEVITKGVVVVRGIDECR